jgi:hypothetical protein
VTTLEVVALVAVAGWLALLTLGLLLTIRQVALVMVRLDTGATESDDGPMIGMPVPREAIDVLPDLDLELRYLLFLTPNCGPCGTLASELDDPRLAEQPVIAVLRGDERGAGDLGARLPSRMARIEDPDASVIAESLRVRGAPFAVQVEHGIVSGRAVVAGADDLVRLVDAHAYSDAEEMAKSLREVVDSGR